MAQGVGLRRYIPTDDEARDLEDLGWRCDSDGWWYPLQLPTSGANGLTYREAMRRQASADKAAAVKRGRGRV